MGRLMFIAINGTLFNTDRIVMATLLKAPENVDGAVSLLRLTIDEGGASPRCEWHYESDTFDPQAVIEELKKWA